MSIEFLAYMTIVYTNFKKNNLYIANFYNQLRNKPKDYKFMEYHNKVFLFNVKYHRKYYEH